MRRKPIAVQAPPPCASADGKLLWLPALPPSLNDWTRAHWHVRAKMVSEWKRMVEMALLMRRPPRVSREACLVLWFLLPDHRRRDLDNLAPKAIIDALVSAEVLADDSMSCVPSIVLSAVHAPFAGTLVSVEDGLALSADRAHALLESISPGALSDTGATLGRV